MSEENKNTVVVEAVDQIDVYTNKGGSITIAMNRDEGEEDELIWFPKSQASKVIAAIRECVKGDR